ncbi:exonuclease VII small subunit [Candidatus Pelagibacter sp. HIMB1506]|uniref:exonuclease VII small subunit n=1 Tax=Candidatus Pelagibacter sp. HIMB1506 TaxID=3413337 RepID=UPI003F84E8F0
MKDKNLPLDYDNRTLEELTDEANQMIKSLEEKDDLDNSVESYQELLKLNNLIEKKFQKNLRSISANTNKKIKDIIKRK